MRLPRIRRAPRALIPSAPQGDHPHEIIAHVGGQTVRIPTLMLVEQAREMVTVIDEWRRTASGAELVLYGAVKQAANLAIPLLRSRIERNPHMPDMPKRERHTDPITFLVGYFNLFLPYALSQGEFIVPVDAEGNAGKMRWTYLEELIAEAEALEGEPLVIEAAEVEAPNA